MFSNDWKPLFFVNEVFLKRAMLLIFYTEYTESVIDILLPPESTMGPPLLGQEKNFQSEGSQKAGKRYFKTGSCKYKNASFN